MNTAPGADQNAPTPGRFLCCGRFRLALDRPLVMGVVNVTPDSFFDGGRFAAADAAIAHAHRLLDEGADILDIGGESTRPGAPPVDTATERARIEPVLRALARAGRPLSVDTRNPEVMAAALDAGADMINDISGFASEAAIAAVQAGPAALCVMHMQGDPATMQVAPVYRDVVSEVREFLYLRVQALLAAGVAHERIVVDPGIGFGKTQPQNVLLLRSLRELSDLPVLVGLSRKSLIGHLTGRIAAERLAGSLGGALGAIERGASIVRVHDVAATRDLIAVWSAIAGPEKI